MGLEGLMASDLGKSGGGEEQARARLVQADHKATISRDAWSA